MLTETLKPTGELTITLRGPDGAIKEQKTVPNVVTTNGKQFIALSVIKTTTNTPPAMTLMGIGIGTAVADVGNFALNNQLGATQTLSTSSSGPTVTYTASFGAAYVGAVTEAGVFNVNGTMLCRTVFSAVNKTSLDTLTITWNVTIG